MQLKKFVDHTLKTAEVRFVYTDDDFCVLLNRIDYNNSEYISRNEIRKWMYNLANL